MPSPNSDQPQLLNITKVIEATSLSRSSIYRDVKAGTFPAPVRLKRRRVAWRAADIAAWSADPMCWGAEAEF